MRRSARHRAFPALIGASMVAAFLALPSPAPAQDPARPDPSSFQEPRDGLRLIVVVVIDQLRADAFLRFGPALGKDGLLRLVHEGVWYREASYSHAHTVTGVGHATIGTGARPCDHGIAANDWYDRKTGASVYCVADAASTVVGTAGETGNASPLNLTASTFADEWVFATGGRARAFGVSEKDRGAILPVGKSGKAFWYSLQSGRMITSTYYYKDIKALPDWVVDFDKKAPADAWFKKSWERTTRDDDGTMTAADYRPFESEVQGNGKVFPHPFGKGSEKPDAKFYEQVRASPAGDALVADFALTLLREEKLGKGDLPDILTISFSANDLAGHTWGPDSVEAKEVLCGVDRQVARLLAALDSWVGPGRYLLALTADHAIMFPPEVLAARGYPGGRFSTDDMKKKILRRLDFTVRYLDWALGFNGPGFWFDPDALKWGGKPAAELEAIAAEVIRETPGIVDAFTRTDILAGRIPDSDIGRRVRASFHATRSPDVYVIPVGFWIEGGVTTHGTPYAYDSQVPLVFFGAGLSPREVFRPVDVMDLAATMSALLGTCMPSACGGKPLQEVTEGVHARSRRY